MDHEELLKKIEERIDRLEQSLRPHFERAASQDTDIKWIKGWIKVSLTAIMAIVSSIIAAFVQLNGK